MTKIIYRNNRKTLSFYRKKWSNFNLFNPFELKRSAGAGLRIFMPAFGLLGIDFGYGFDEDLRPQSIGQGPSGWQTHFIIGQQF